MNELNIRKLVENWAGQPDDVIKVEGLVNELEKVVGPIQNEIIHLQTQLRQSEQALAASKVKSYNEGVEDSARLIEGGDYFMSEGLEQEVAEEIRNLKQ